MPSPQSVIHINFTPGAILFDARPVWSALRRTESNSQVPRGVSAAMEFEFGNTALSIATRYLLMTVAVRELGSSLRNMYALVPPASQFALAGEDIYGVRDRVLLYTDAVLFEFKAFLELLANLAYGILTGIGKTPNDQQALSTGQTMMLRDRRGNLKAHSFVLYLCDQLGVSTDWYYFLQTHRNFFTHEAAPYCAIEPLPGTVPQFDTIIMRKNIHVFTDSNASDYFRVSELQRVVEGVSQLSAAVQSYLVETVVG